MGQKTNPNIYRLGLQKNDWPSKYFEKNKEESTDYGYKTVQIKNYLIEFLNKNSLLLHESKLYFNDSNLHVFISYYKQLKKKTVMKRSTTPIKSLQYKTKKQATKILSKARLKSKMKLSQFLSRPPIKSLLKKRKKFFIRKQNIKVRRISILNKYRNFLQQQKYQNKDTLMKNNMSQQLLESLALFTNKKYNIIITLQNLNRGLSLRLTETQKKSLKKKLLSLRRYSKNPFFQESLNIMLIVIKIKNSSQLLANFITNQIQYLKKHNYFLVYLKTILKFFINLNFSKIKGVKIIINGRFNGAPRSKRRIILTGGVPVQTINKYLSYSQSTSYTKNGTFGVKVWIA